MSAARRANRSTRKSNSQPRPATPARRAGGSKKGALDKAAGKKTTSKKAAGAAKAASEKAGEKVPAKATTGKTGAKKAAAKKTAAKKRTASKKVAKKVIKKVAAKAATKGKKPSAEQRSGLSRVPQASSSALGVTSAAAGSEGRWSTMVPGPVTASRQESFDPVSARVAHQQRESRLNTAFGTSTAERDRDDTVDPALMRLDDAVRSCAVALRDLELEEGLDELGDLKELEDLADLGALREGEELDGLESSEAECGRLVQWMAETADADDDAHGRRNGDDERFGDVSYHAQGYDSPYDVETGEGPEPATEAQGWLARWFGRLFKRD